MLVCGAISDLVSNKRMRCQIYRNLQDFKYIQHGCKLIKKENVTCYLLEKLDVELEEGNFWDTLRISLA
jgi:hypothetical protein